MTAPLRLGIAGLGTVGASLINILNRKHNDLASKCGRSLVVSGVSARDKTKDRGCDLSNAEWFTDPVDLAAKGEIDVFVELIGGEGGPALEAVEKALESGKHVVTANKAMLAKHGVRLARMAEERGLILNYEAAVAGGIPIIKTMRESLSANSVSRVYGILNGTCNYILTRMEAEGIAFDACLKDAQALGYAEADPTFDIDGFDTAHKLAILASIAFGTQIAADDIYVEGIRSITTEDIQAAADLGYRIKLLGVAQKTESGIEQRVHPTLVSTDTPIAQIAHVTNAVGLDTDVLGELVMSGPGAGGDATASAVAGDIADIAKAREGEQHAPALGTPAKDLKPAKKARMRAHEGGYFIRLTVKDQTGVFASIATRMAEQNISLESIVQRKSKKAREDAQPVILVTHETSETAIKNALKMIEEDGHLSDRAQMIRIET